MTTQRTKLAISLAYALLILSIMLLWESSSQSPVSQIADCGPGLQCVVTIFNLPYLSCIEVGEGLAAVAWLLLLFQTKDYLTRRMPSLHAALTRRIAVSRNVRVAALILSLAGAVAFLFMVSVDMGYNVPAADTTAKWILHNFFNQYGLTLSQVGFPVAMAVTITLTIYHLNDGIADAFSWAVRRFLAPAITTLGLAILIFDYREISLYAANFVPWVWEGIYPVNNWTILLVSAFVTMYPVKGSRTQRQISEPAWKETPTGLMNHA